MTDGDGQPQESVGRRAALGAAWSILSSIGGRMIGLISTLVLTRYLDPEVYGAVSVAVAIVGLDDLTEFALLQYIVAKPEDDPQTNFHAAFFHITIGVVTILAIYLLSEPLARAFSSGGASVYIFGLCIFALVKKVSMVPEHLLAKDLRFGTIEGTRAVGEVLYSVSAVALAIFGFSGLSIVYANIGQWTLFAVAMIGFAGLRRWARPCPLSWSTTRKIWAFGFPISIGAIADTAACDWDDLIIARMFGEATVGRYILAKNLASIPALHVGQHVGIVLLPSFAQMDDEQRREALLPAHALLALVVTPLAAGLGVVAPTLTAALFNDEWQGIVWMLAILSALSAFRPIGLVAHSYLLAIDRPKTSMSLNILKAILLLGCVIAFAQFGVLWACAAVGLGFFVHSMIALVTLWRVDQVDLKSLMLGTFQPVFAVVPMAAAVLAVRAGLDSVGVAAGIVTLIAEIAAGGLVYIAAGLVLVPSTSRRFIRLVKVALLRMDEEEEKEDDDGEGDNEGEGEEM